MKKKLFTALALVCAVVCAFALTACGHTHEYSAEWSSDETDHWHACTVESCTEVKDKAAHTWDDGVITTPATAAKKGVKTFTCTVCNKTKTEPVEYVGPSLTETTDFDALVSDIVTEEEWKAAFSESAFENATQKLLRSGDEMHSKINGDYRVFDTGSPNGEGNNRFFYVAKEDGQKYVYASEDGETFSKHLLSEMFPNVDENLYFSFKIICPDLSTFYSKFTYDNVKGAYVYNGYSIEFSAPMQMSPEAQGNISVKIVGGKVAFVSSQIVDSDFYKVYMYDYGTTEVNLPTVITTE